MKEYTDEEIRKMAGHPDCTPPQYIEWFLKGFRACEQQKEPIKMLMSEDLY